jgi:DNA-binding transcriptional regulator YhcF (GntR family)
METVMIQVNNNLAFKFFQNLEALNVIKVLQKTPEMQLETAVRVKKDNSLKSKRLARIKAVTKNINIDLTNYRFNREEANNYDE